MKGLYRDLEFLLNQSPRGPRDKHEGLSMPLDVRKIVFDLKNLIKGSSLLLVDSLLLIRNEIVNFRMDILPLISSKNSNIFSASYSIFLSYLPLWL